MNTKSSLYDFFAMVIPGFLWLLLIAFWYKWAFKFTCANNIISGTLLLFIASYFIGLFYHKIVEKGLSYLSKFITKKCIHRLLSCLRKCVDNKKCIKCLLSYRYIFRNDEHAIKRSWVEFRKDYEKNGGKQSKSSASNLHEYYTAYYALMKANMLYNIPVLEAQVALLKNVAPITLIYAIVIHYCDSFLCWYHLYINSCCLTSALLILLVCMVKALVSIQNKIYELVWDGYEYLELIDKDKK
jgi:hypothetical protein